MEMYSFSSSQAPWLYTYSSVYPTNPTINDPWPLNRHSTHDEAAPSDFELERRGRQFASTRHLYGPTTESDLSKLQDIQM